MSRQNIRAIACVSVFLFLMSNLHPDRFFVLWTLTVVVLAVSLFIYSRYNKDFSVDHLPMLKIGMAIDEKARSPMREILLFLHYSALGIGLIGFILFFILPVFFS